MPRGIIRLWKKQNHKATGKISVITLKSETTELAFNNTAGKLFCVGGMQEDYFNVEQLVD